MSNYTIEVIEQSNSLDVVEGTSVALEIISSDNFITFDTPSGYPLDATSGILPVNRMASGYPLSYIPQSNTLVYVSGDQIISGVKYFADSIVSSGSFSLKSQPTASGATHFPVFINDPSSLPRLVYTRTANEIKSDLGISNVQNLALSGINFTAGSGIVGGGNLSSHRSFDIGQGDGISVGADSISVDSTVIRSTNIDQIVSGVKTFSTSGVVLTSPTGSFKKDLVLRGVAGSSSNNNIVVTPVSTLVGNRIYSLPDVGADADFVMTAGGQTITGPKAFTNSLIFNSGSFQSLKVGITDVSISGHTHTSSNITNFASSVSGLLPVTNLLPSGGIGITQSGTIFTISTTGTFGLTQSQVDDRVNTIVSGVYAPLNSPTFTGTISGISKSMVGLSNVDNTNDVNKPVSTAQATANSGVQAFSIQRSNHTGTQTSSTISDFNTSVSGLVNGIYAPLSSPSFAGVPTAPTASSGTNTTQIASTAFVRTEISNLISAAPSALDTLNELSAALGNDPNFATTITNNLASKANLSGATFTGSVSGPSGNFTSLKVNNVDVSSVGHTHISSNITDFNSSVSGLLPVRNVLGSGFISVSAVSGNFTVSTTGLQPSGNYSVVGHSHTSNDITNFNSSVSGLLTPYQLVLTNPVTGVGSSGYLSRWTSSSNISSGIIFDNGTNVGIGTTTPTAQLQVVGTGLFTNIDINGSVLAGSAALTVNGGILTQGAFVRSSSFTIYGDNTTQIYKPDASTLGYAVSSTGLKHSFGYNNAGTHTPWAVITSSGVGIGTTTPSGQIHVVGTGIFSSGILAGSGSQTSPSYSFLGNTNTGFYNPATNALSLTTSGVNRLYIDPIGSVGIGGSPQAGFKLDVIGGDSIFRGAVSSNSYFYGYSIDYSVVRYQFSNSLAGGGANRSFACIGGGTFGVGFTAPSGRVAISGGVAIGSNFNFTPPTDGLIVQGNIGIGTTTPSGQLHVVGTGIFSSGLSVGSTTNPRTVYISGAIPLQGELLRLQNGSSANNTYLDVGVGTAGNFDDHIIFYRGTGTGANTRIFGIDSSNRLVGFVNWTMFGNQTISSYNNGNSLIRMQNLTTNDMEISAVSGIAFQSSQSTRMRMDQSGNFGLGTTTPTSALDINSNSFRVRTAKTPASATDTGNAGDICWDSNYIYICVTTNTWKRSAITTW